MLRRDFVSEKNVMFSQILIVRYEMKHKTLRNLFLQYQVQALVEALYEFWICVCLYII